MLNSSREREHLCFVTALREEEFFSSWSMIVAAVLLYIAFTILRNLKIKTTLSKRSTQETSLKQKKNSFSDSQLITKGCIQKKLYFTSTTKPVKVEQTNRQFISPRVQLKSYSVDVTQGFSGKVQEMSASLRTIKDQFVGFIYDNGDYEIHIQDLTTEQEKDYVLLTYYFQPSLQESESQVDGVYSNTPVVSLSPVKHRNCLLHADDDEQSVKLQESKEPLPNKALFHLHKIAFPRFKFECKDNPGVFLGVKDNQLALIKIKDQTEEMNTIFQIFIMK